MAVSLVVSSTLHCQLWFDLRRPFSEPRVEKVGLGMSGAMHRMVGTPKNRIAAAFQCRNKR